MNINHHLSGAPLAESFQPRVSGAASSSEGRQLLPATIPSQPGAQQQYSRWKLPFDIIYLISRHGSFETCIAIRQTCKDCYDRIKYTSLLAPTKIDFMKKAEKFPRNKGCLACFHCARILPSSKFSMSQRRHRHAAGCQRQDGSRYCIDCGIAQKLFTHLKAVRTKRGTSRLNGRVSYFCHKCSSFGTPGRRCIVRKELRPNQIDEDDITVQNITHCLPKDPKGRDPLFCGTPKLECLPRSVQERTFSHLDYPSLIAIRQANHWFHEVVDTQQASLLQKFQFVRQREMMVRNWDPDSRACFSCFRLRPRRDFEDKGSRQFQLAEERKPHKAWKRRCSSCLYKLYGQHADGVAAAEWRGRRYCIRCEGLYYHNQACEGCAILGPAPEEIVEDEDWSNLEPMLWSYKHVKHAVRIEPKAKEPRPIPPPPEAYPAANEVGRRISGTSQWMTRQESTKWREETRELRLRRQSSYGVAAREIGIFHDDRVIAAEIIEVQNKYDAYHSYYDPDLFYVTWPWNPSPIANTHRTERILELDRKRTILEDRISPLQVLFGVDEFDHPYEDLIERMSVKEKKTAHRGFFPSSGRDGSRPTRPIKTGAQADQTGAQADQTGAQEPRTPESRTWCSTPNYIDGTISSMARQFGRELDTAWGTMQDTNYAPGVSCDSARSGTPGKSAASFATGGVAPPALNAQHMANPMVDTSWTARRGRLVNELRNIVHQVRSSSRNPAASRRP
ncbi:uncharacterized protein MKZ38_001663 [Zalerion maritima]|uniref:F-box domain-containing protein n=1 Tax=Zalerion maritima TaxID=339359 RepID=A0AAD5RPZ0_9PEZI|nr:uncharacterized protein MKZ38_001663 [Zalerion maritima]